MAIGGSRNGYYVLLQGFRGKRGYCMWSFLSVRETSGVCYQETTLPRTHDEDAGWTSRAT